MNNTTVRIIVDAFGGDNAPQEIVKGAVLAAAEDYAVTLVGDEAAIRRVAAEQGVSLDGIEVAHAADVITMEDEPRSILKEHAGCSMAEGLRLLAAGKGDAFVTAGSTGALIMGSTFIVKRIKGISRAALATILPGDNGPFMLIDSGANAESRPEMLLQFAHMGSIYMGTVLGDGQPATVGMVNVGVEETKGGALQHEAFALLRDSGLPFVGNVEARELTHNAAQVIVTDGFTGNVILKLMEGVAESFMGSLKDILFTNGRTKAAALLLKPYLKAFKTKMDTSTYGGAPLLGVKKPVIKTHGNAKAPAVKNAIRVAADFARGDVIDRIAAAVRPTAETEETP